MGRRPSQLLFVCAVTLTVGAIVLLAGRQLAGGRMQRVEAEVERLRAENRALSDSLEKYAQLDARVQEMAGKLDRLEETPAQPALHAFRPPMELSFCGERLPLREPEVYQRFEEEWNRFLVNRHWLVSWMRRSRDAYPLVEAKLAAAGLPEDLKYVMTIESAIDPRATSSAGAVGYWQFIHETGKRYGLDRDNNVDERRDLAKATDAAIAYLSDLYEEFQSWPLALSAYNCGESRVRSEIELQGTNDYYALTLPRETEAYWFKAAALKPLFESPERYGIELANDGWQAAVCDTLQLKVDNGRVDLRRLAEASGMSYRELKRFNPWFRRSFVDRGTHKLVVPHGAVDELLVAVEGLERTGIGGAQLANSASAEAPVAAPPAAVANPDN